MWIIVETVVAMGDGEEDLTTKVWGPFKSKEMAEKTAKHNKINTFEVHVVVMPTSKPAW